MYAHARQTGRRDPARFFVGEGLTAVLRYGGWALVCRLALSLNLRITELKGLLDRPASQNWRLRSHMPQRYLRECRAESDRTWGSLAARPPKHMDDAKGRLGPWNLTDEMVRSIVSERSKGRSLREIADRHGVSTDTVCRALASADRPTTKPAPESGAETESEGEPGADGGRVLVLLALPEGREEERQATLTSTCRAKNFPWVTTSSSRVRLRSWPVPACFEFPHPNLRLVLPRRFGAPSFGAQDASVDLLASPPFKD